MKILGNLLLFVLLSCVPAWAQTDPIAANRKITWTGTGVTPATRTTVCQSIAAYTGTAATINTAIQNCTAEQVVSLGAGTFNLSTGIDFNNKSNVTLRGAGPTQTIINFSAGATCGGLGGNVCVENSSLNWTGIPGNVANWTAGYAKGTTSITLSNTTNLAIGSLIMLDQENDSNTDNGEVWVCEAVGVCSTDGNTTGRPGPPKRDQIQISRVTNIVGGTVTISPGVYMPNFVSGKNPQAWWSSSAPISGVGIEDMTLDHTNSDANAGVYFYNAYANWVKNVKSLNGNLNHAWFYQSFGNTVRDSYFYGTKNAASQSYGVQIHVGAGNLVENNIFQHVSAPIMWGTAAQGNVASYNYTQDNYHQAGPSFAFSSHWYHDSGISYNLAEGNDLFGVTFDQIHGTSHFGTIFRNRLTGWESQSPSLDQQTVSVHIYTFSRYHNAVGNVLGASTYHTKYEAYPASASDCNTSIYALGFGGNCQNGPIPNDTLVRNTLMRWGNYDTVNAANRFVAGEVPSGDAFYPNSVPGDQTLINSYYLAAKPTFMGNLTWPPTGPDVTGGDITGLGGHAYKIPARVCYETTTKTGGILDYDYPTCHAAISGGGGGIATFSITPTYTFSDTRPGVAATYNASVINTGNASLTVNSVIVTVNTKNFSQSSSCGILAPTAACTIIITFVAHTAGAMTQATITVDTTVNDPSATLDGTGLTIPASMGVQ